MQSLSCSEWSPASFSHSQCFTRQLGLTEFDYYLDSIFNGTSDITHHIAVQSLGVHLSPELFQKSWVALKRRFPILGARIVEHEDVNGADFIVDLDNLNTVQEGEIMFLEAHSLQNMEKIISEHMVAPRCLSNSTLAAMKVFRRTDEPRYDLLFVVAHSITDGMSIFNQIRNYLDILAMQANVEYPRLEDRLSIAVASESLRTGLTSNLARRRWKSAIAHVLWQNTIAKTTGGHTLPNSIKPRTRFTPALSRKAIIRLPQALSQAIAAACRDRKITFNIAYLVIAQIALARVLYRLRKRGEISDDEWAFRLREPTHSAGPLNLRPFRSPEWLRRGGETELGVYISFYQISLPHIPSVHGGQHSEDFAVDDSGAPPFSALLSNEGFTYRCTHVRRQIALFFNHPLFQDVIAQRGPLIVARERNTALLWRRIQNGEDVPLQQIEYTSNLVFAHTGSSLGNADRLLPIEYPLPSDYETSLRMSSQTEAQTSAVDVTARDTPGVVAPPSKQLRIMQSDTHLRCRPTELYLGADTTHGQMRMYVFYDGNVYKEAVVKEWLEEVRAATLWYLLDNTSFNAKL